MFSRHEILPASSTLGSITDAIKSAVFWRGITTESSSSLNPAIATSYRTCRPGLKLCPTSVLIEVLVKINIFGRLICLPIGREALTRGITYAGQTKKYPTRKTATSRPMIIILHIKTQRQSGQNGRIESGFFKLWIMKFYLRKMNRLKLKRSQ